MNQQANFKEIEIGYRYTNGLNRTVDILSVEKVTDPQDATRTVDRYEGQLYRPNMQPDTRQYFQRNGTCWNERGVSNPMDLATCNGPSPSVATA